MSRITPPVTKFTHATRRISSSANARRPFGILDSQSRASRCLPRKVSDLNTDCSKRQLKTTGSKAEPVDRLAAHDLVTARGIRTSGGHRPVPKHHTSVYKIISLMKGFHNSAPKQAARDSSTIDFFFFPEIPAPPPINPYQIRVPLLPDNYNPDRSVHSAHAIETPDGAVPSPEISIIASHPENVAPAAMSEVVGNDGLDFDIGQLTAGFSSTAVKDLKEPGVLKELWNGLVDDIFGSKHASQEIIV